LQKALDKGHLSPVQDIVLGLKDYFFTAGQSNRPAIDFGQKGAQILGAEVNDVILQGVNIGE